MKRNSIMKVVCVFAFTTVIISSLAGCGNNSEKPDKNKNTISEADIDDSSVTDDNNSSGVSVNSTDMNISDSDSLTIETTKPETATEPVSTTETEKAIEIISEPVIADLSFLYGSPNRIEITARKYNIEASEGTDENEPGYYQAEIDIIDTGSNYLLGIDKIKYYLGVANYRSFIENAVVKDGSSEDENGKMIYNYKIIKGYDTLNCCGENFTLVSYYKNDMGRGNCEFVGEDGETYYLYNDLSSYIDDFTGVTYFKLVTEDGQEAFREIEFEEGIYIEIPYDMAEGTGMKQFADNSPDENSGNPGGYYYMAFDSDGNLTKVQGW